MPRRRVALILPALVLVASTSAAGATAVPRPSSPRTPGRLVPETHVQASDDRFEPTVPNVPRGGTVVFDFTGPVDHHQAKDTRLNLYDSPPVEPSGPSFRYTFTAAGVYPFECQLHLDVGMTGRIHVPMRAAPKRGSLRRVYTLTWASVDASAGFAYDVRIKRPRHGWRGWRSEVEVRKATYRPHAGKGVYRFEARLRRTGTSDTGAPSLWSDAVSISVG